MRHLILNSLFCLFIFSCVSQTKNDKNKAIEFNNRAIDLMINTDDTSVTVLNRALGLLDSAIAIDNFNCLFYSNKVQILIKLNKIEQTIEVLSSLLKEKCQTPGFFLVLGVLQEITNRVSDSKINYEHAYVILQKKQNGPTSHLNMLLAEYLLDDNMVAFKKGLVDVEKYEEYKSIVKELKNLEKRQDIIDVVISMNFGSERV